MMKIGGGDGNDWGMDSNIAKGRQPYAALKWNP